MRKHLFLLSISSDIGFSIACHYLKLGWKVTGTYRRMNAHLVEASDLYPNLTLIPCDLSHDFSIANLVSEFAVLEPWDLFVSAVGEPLPLTSFATSDWAEWISSFYINSLAQLEVLHKLIRYKNRDRGKPTVVFFAAGGTNGPVSNFSAYTSAKIHLTKMVELLAHEDKATRYCIVGPGWTPSKTHMYMLGNLPRGDDRIELINKFVAGDKAGTSHNTICRFIDWCLGQDDLVINGRNFSIVNDDWQGKYEPDLVKLLKGDPDMFKLRRYRNDGV